MQIQDTASKVLIIGAGLGGLALAQILHHHHVPFEIFERDEDLSVRKQGWAVAIIEALPALERLLSAKTFRDLRTTSVNHNTGENDEVAFVDALTGKVAGKTGGIAYGQQGSVLRASRETLRNYLWRADDLPVTRDKVFTHYSEDVDGVTAFFADGTKSHGSLLIGADGVHSRVREQLLGSTGPKPVQSQIVPIFGELELPKEQYEPLRRLANAVILTVAPGVRQVIGQLSMASDRSRARFFWALMFRCEDPEAFAHWVGKSSSQELYDFVGYKAKSFHPTMRSFIEYGGPGALVRPQPKFLEFVPSEALPADGRVILLGDAAHVMIPLRGAGANTALLDACDLGRLIIEARAEGRELTSIVAPYVTEMIPRGREAVLTSRAAGSAEGDDPAIYGQIFSRQEASK